MDQVIRVLVVDDSAYVRKVVKQMLLRSPFIEVVGAARDGEEAVELVEATRSTLRNILLNESLFLIIFVKFETCLISSCK